MRHKHELMLYAKNIHSTLSVKKQENHERLDDGKCLNEYDNNERTHLGNKWVCTLFHMV